MSEHAFSGLKHARHVCVLLPQVDPLNLPVAVSSEDYVPPEDVLFDQVWDPSVMLPTSKRATAPNLDDLVEEFAGAVSHDKVREPVPCCGVFVHRGVFGVCCSSMLLCHSRTSCFRARMIVPSGNNSKPAVASTG